MSVLGLGSESIVPSNFAIQDTRIYRAPMRFAGWSWDDNSLPSPPELGLPEFPSASGSQHLRACPRDWGHPDVLSQHCVRCLNIALIEHNKEVPNDQLSRCILTIVRSVDHPQLVGLSITHDGSPEEEHAADPEEDQTSKHGNGQQSTLNFTRPCIVTIDEFLNLSIGQVCGVNRFGVCAHAITIHRLISVKRAIANITKTMPINIVYIQR